MRPLPGDEVYKGRSRSSSGNNDTTPLASRSQQPQMTYFFADEKAMESSVSPSSPTQPKQRESKSSSYGVESLDTTISSLSNDNDDFEERVRKARHNWKKNLGRPTSRHSEEDLASVESPSIKSFEDFSRNASPSYQRRPSQATISRPYTPLSFGSPALHSNMSSPGSRRTSDAGLFMDDAASQAITSSGEEEGNTGSELIDSGSAPQLVMPSIKMPSRRPFTDRGKNMGRLKVLIAGGSSVGKTSLIKAIVQSCEDIVHVDPLSTMPANPIEIRRKSRSKSRSRSSDMLATSQITEVYASTRAYPAWWSDLEESRVLRRRKSMGDSVLERNLCFVDTPGYSNKTSCLECITPVVEYVQSQFKKLSSPDSATESDMVNMLTGNGGTQVDLVFYMVQHRIKPVDIEYLQRLSQLTNVIPLIAQADRLSSEELTWLKDNITSELHTANIKPFVFTSLNEMPHPKPTAPYAISTHPSKDLEAMDASLLMSSEYIQPLVNSELLPLVAQLFERDNISWLRHSAAKKLLQWRASSTPLSKPAGLYRPFIPASSSGSPSQILTTPVGATTSYALARITDHTQREERIAQIRLANWAADLQRSLQNERMRFDSLARSDRAVWLTERLGECVQDGTIVPISQAQVINPIFDAESHALVKQGTYWRQRKAAQGLGSRRSMSVDRHDPLGLLQLNRELRRKAWALVKFMGGIGILGGVAFWLVRGYHVGDTTSWGIGGLTVRDMIDFGMVDWTA